MIRGSSIDRLGPHLMHRARSHHSRVEFNLAKGTLISRNVLLENRHKCLCLLRTQIDSLKITDFHLSLALLLQGAEHQEEIPNIYAHLHAVSIVFAVVRRVEQLDIGLRGYGHKCFSVAAARLVSKAGTLGY